MSEQEIAQIRVLVVVAEGRSGHPRLLQLLHEANLTIDVLSCFGPYGEGTSYVNRQMSVTPKNLLVRLQELLSLEQSTYKWVIFKDETALRRAKEAIAEPWMARHFPVDAAGDMPEIITSKARFTLACQQASITLPTSVVCDSLPQARDAAMKIGFPVMIKSDHGMGGVGVRKAGNEAELQSILEAMAGPWIVQKFVTGRVGSVQLLLDRGQVLCWFPSFKREVFPPPFGPSCCRELIWHEDLEKMVHKLAEMTGFRGLCGMDFMIDTDNRLYVTELNARPTPHYHLGPHAGVDFRRSIRSLVGLESAVPQSPDRHRLDGRVIYNWPQWGMHCIYTGPVWKLIYLAPGLFRNDTPWRRPRLLLSQGGDLMRRLFKTRWEKLSRLLGRKTSKSTGEQPIDNTAANTSR